MMTRTIFTVNTKVHDHFLIYWTYASFTHKDVFIESKQKYVKNVIYQNYGHVPFLHLVIHIILPCYSRDKNKTL